MLRRGGTTVRRNQIPALPAVAATKFPSADDATAFQIGAGWLLVVQFIPELVEKAEKAVEVPPTVTSRVPSADTAIERKSELATPLGVKEAPPFVEM